MSRVALKTYQEVAVSGLVEWVQGSHKCKPSTVFDGFALLEAPTGAGKTVMLASVIDRSCRDKVVVLFSPGKGDLEEQTFRSVSKYLEGSTVDVVRLSESYLSSHQSIPAGTVLVTNWEELVGKNRSGEYLKKLVKGKENVLGLVEVLKNTAEKDIPLLIVNDEAHYGKGGRRLTGIEELLGEISDAVGYKPFLLDATATPIKGVDVAAVQAGFHRWQKVDKNDVIDEGMLVKEIAINPGVQKQLDSYGDDGKGDITGELLVLESALAKRNELILLAQACQVEGSKIPTPLILVQVPNDKKGVDAGKKKIDMVERFFATHGITAANGKLAKNLSGDKSDQTVLDGLNDPDSVVEVLIFKQGISMGWDCPRAQILIGFREIGSEIFGVQTIGRIMRTPERKHYNVHGGEDLDKAFLYTTVGTTNYQRDEDKTPNKTAYDVYRRTNLYSKETEDGKPTTLFEVKRIEGNDEMGETAETISQATSIDEVTSTIEVVSDGTESVNVTSETDVIMEPTPSVLAETVIPGKYIPRDNTWRTIDTDEVHTLIENNETLKVLAEEINNDTSFWEENTTSIITDQKVGTGEILDGKVEDNENTYVSVRRSSGTLEVDYEETLLQILGNNFPAKQQTLIKLKPLIKGWVETYITQAPRVEKVNKPQHTLFTTNPTNTTSSTNPNDTADTHPPSQPVSGVEKIKSTRRTRHTKQRVVRTQTIQEIFTHATYKERLTHTFRSILQKYVDNNPHGDKKAESVNYLWKPQPTLTLNETNTLTLNQYDTLTDLYLYENSKGEPVLPTKTLSEPEKSFQETHIRTWCRENKILWWFKNGESMQGAEVADKRFYSITYTDPKGVLRIFYPDYIIQFTDGTTGVFEVKDHKMSIREAGRDEENAPIKATTLQQLENDNDNIIAGVVYPVNQTFNIVTESNNPTSDIPLNVHVSNKIST